MRSRAVQALCIAASGLWFSAGLVGCGDEASVEDQVKGVLDAMETAAENARPLEFMGHVADDFQGQDGRMQRNDFLRFMTLQINRYRRLRAQRFPVTVTADGGNFANATIRVLVTGGQGLLPENGQLYDVETTWIREDGDWKLWRASWSAAGNG